MGNLPNQSACFCVDLEKVFDIIPWGNPIGGTLKIWTAWKRELGCIDNNELDLFLVAVGLCWGCLLTQILFVTFIDRICRWILSLLFVFMLALLGGGLQLAVEQFIAEK